MEGEWVFRVRDEREGWEGERVEWRWNGCPLVPFTAICPASLIPPPPPTPTPQLCDLVVVWAGMRMRCRAEWTGHSDDGCVNVVCGEDELAFVFEEDRVCVCDSPCAKYICVCFIL